MCGNLIRYCFTTDAIIDEGNRIHWSYQDLCPFISDDYVWICFMCSFFTLESSFDLSVVCVPLKIHVSSAFHLRNVRQTTIIENIGSTRLWWCHHMLSVLWKWFVFNNTKNMITFQWNPDTLRDWTEKAINAEHVSNLSTLINFIQICFEILDSDGVCHLWFSS